MGKTFERQSFAKRLKSMLKVDVRRMLTSSFFYIMVAIAFVVPVLILVMTTMMDGSVSVDQNGNEVVMQGFDNVWQILGSVSGSASQGEAGMGMDMVSMCNVNLLYFAVAVFVCVFIADDFRSGYAKNLFTVRAKKTDYVVSKTVVGLLGAAAMFIAFFVGAMIGGGVAGLPFEMVGFNLLNVACSMLAKIFISLVFVGMCVLAGVIAKQKSWLSLVLAFGLGMLFFTMIPMVTPLDSTPIHTLLCLVGGALFAFGLGAISNAVLKKTSLV